MNTDIEHWLAAKFPGTETFGARLGRHRLIDETTA